MSAPSSIIFHHAPQTRSGIVRWMLEEADATYDLRPLNLKLGEHKRDEYFAVNPMGKVPAIQHDGVVITEVAAICCYLADLFPEAQLAPKIGDPKRGEYLRWMFFAPGCIEPAMWDKALKREAGQQGMIGYGDFDTAIDVAGNAVARGPYILGEHFSAADVVLGSTIGWGVKFGIVPARPEFTAYGERLTARPANQLASRADAELAATFAP